jgi:Membrane protein involved in the export of O-antigen and teichoic acid
MFKKLGQNQLFKDSAIYTFGAVFQRGISVFLIPIYIGVLTTDKFGQLDFLNTLSFLLSIICSVGLPQVILTEFYNIPKEGKLKFYNNIGISYLYIAIPLYLIILILFLFWGNTIFSVNISARDTILAFIYSFFIFFQTMFFSALRLTFRSLEYMLINVINGLLLGGINILLVYFFHFGLSGILITSCITYGVTSLLGFVRFRKRLTPNWYLQTTEAKKLLLLGFPFMFSSAASWFTNFADRWIILKNLSQSDLGIYSLASKFSAVYDSLIINPLVGAYTPHLFKKFSEKRYFIPYHIIIPFTLVLFGGLVFVSEFLISLFAKGDYAQAQYLIPYMVMAYAFSFIAQITASVIIFFKKSRQLIYNIVFTGISNVILNLVFIHHFKLKGSAYALLISYFIWAMLTVAQSVVIIRGAKNKKHK